MNERITGGCRCGTIRYDLMLDRLPPVYCCHCRDCQTWTGSAFSQQAVVHEGDLVVNVGEPVEYAFTSPSGSLSRQYACATCHTRLYNTNSARPGLVIVRAGTLDASDRLEAVLHIWTKRKQPWIAFAADVPAFPESAPAEVFRNLVMGEQR